MSSIPQTRGHVGTSFVLWLTFAMSLSAQERLSVEDAVRLALDHSRSLKAASLEIDRAAENVSVAKTGRLPQLSVLTIGGQLLTRPGLTLPEGSLGRLADGSVIPAANTTVEAARRPGAFLFAQVNQPLTQLRRIGLQIDIAKTGEQLSEAQLQLSKQQIANQVRRTYYEIVQTESEIESAEESIRFYRDLDQLTLRYLRQETVLQSDVLDVQARFAQAQYQAAVLNDSLTTQKEQLNQLLGRPIDTGFSIDPMLELAADTPEASQAGAAALKSRPELKQAHLEEKRADLERREKISEYLPDVSLNATYFSLFNVSSALPGNLSSVGFQVQWEPFDWGRKKHQAAEKAEAAEEARVQTEDLAAKIQIEVHAAIRRLEEARQFVAVCRLAQESTRETVRIERVRYDQQAALLKDVLQAQSAKGNADDQVRKALAAFWSARADLQKAMGQDQ